MSLSDSKAKEYLYTSRNVYKNLSLDDLAKFIKEDDTSCVGTDGDVVLVTSGDIKGRLPDDKYVVSTKYAKKNVWWRGDGSDNKSLSRKNWRIIREKTLIDFSSQDLFVVDGYYNSSSANRLAVRLVTNVPVAAYFFKLIAIEPADDEYANFEPQWKILHAPNTVLDDYSSLDLNSHSAIVTNLKERESIIVGTHYLTEINKVMLSAMSYYLSFNNIGVFHCTVGIDNEDNSSMFFGLSGSGKSTLALTNRKLFANGATAWESTGLYSLESGFTIKTASFDRNDNVIQRVMNSAALIENPHFDKNNNVIFGVKSKDQINSQLTFSKSNLDDVALKVAPPKTIIFLTKDSKGVLPRVSRLNKGQAVYHFLSGYTSTSVGIEKDVTEPKLEFSSCYAQPFLLLEPTRYAEILRANIKECNPNIFLVNVGWIEGDCNNGRRVPIEETIEIVNFLTKSETSFTYKREKYFNLKTITEMQLGDKILGLRNEWEDKTKYKKAHKKLAKEFIKNYSQFENNSFAKKYEQFGPSF